MNFSATVCLLVLGSVGSVMPLNYRSRWIRQTSNVNYGQTNNTQVSYTTYPEYTNNNATYDVQNTSPVTVSKNTTESSLTDNNSFTQRLMTYGIYALQVLIVALTGTSVCTILCLYTPVCDNAFGNNSLWKRTPVVRARRYANPDYLNDITQIVFRALEKYSNNRALD